MPSWLEQSAFSGPGGSGFNPSGKTFASTDNRKVTGLIFWLTVACFFSPHWKLIWVYLPVFTVSSWSTGRIVPSKRCAEPAGCSDCSWWWRVGIRRIFEPRSKTEFAWVNFLFICSACCSFITVCFGLKKKLVCLRPDNVKNVYWEVAWRNQVFCRIWQRNWSTQCIILWIVLCLFVFLIITFYLKFIKKTILTLNKSRNLRMSFQF